ncbi:MAG: helix-turn-helix domain-containing protein, partial [Terriglobales bacterium]
RMANASEPRFAELAAVVATEAEGGDPLAREITERAGKELALLADAVIKRLWPSGGVVPVALSGGGEIGAESFDYGKTPLRGARLEPGCKPGLSLSAMERQLLAMTLDATQGNRSRTAEMLGVSLRTVRNKIREYGLPPRSNYAHD